MAEQEKNLQEVEVEAQVAVTDPLEEALERMVKGEGDLAALTPSQRATLYKKVCERLGLDPMTYPLQYLWVRAPGGGERLILYLNKDGAAQLRKVHKVNTRLVDHRILPEVGAYVAVVEASTPDGRVEVETGAVSVRGASPNDVANALMHAVTKAKRRATIAIVGVGFLDETEALSIPDARPARVDVETGEVLEPSPPRKHEVGHEVGQALTKIGEVFRRLGLHDRELAREYASAVVGRPLVSSKELGEEEIEVVLAHANTLLSLGKTPEEYGEAIRELLKSEVPVSDPERSREFVEAYLAF
jgi:hypothetical protein